MSIVADYAAVDGNPPPNFAEMKAAGCSVVIIRRSVCWYDRSHSAWRIDIDPCFARDADAARAAGLIVGAYMFPSFGYGCPLPAEQVAAFKSAPGEIKPGIDLPPGFDVEFPGTGIADTRRSQIEVGDLAIDHIHELAMAFSVPPLVYSSHVEMFDTNGLGGVLAGNEELGACFYWAKTPYRLAAGQPPDQVTPTPPHLGIAAWDKADLWRIPPPFTSYWLVQTQGDCRGFPGIRQCDLGHWNMLSPANPRDVRWTWVAKKLGWTFELTTSAIAASMTAFQTEHELVADGIVGPATFVKLVWGDISSPTVATEDVRAADAADLPQARVIKEKS